MPPHCTSNVMIPKIIECLTLPTAVLKTQYATYSTQRHMYSATSTPLAAGLQAHSSPRPVVDWLLLVRVELDMLVSLVMLQWSANIPPADDAVDAESFCVVASVCCSMLQHTRLEAGIKGFVKPPGPGPADLLLLSQPLPLASAEPQDMLQQLLQSLQQQQQPGVQRYALAPPTPLVEEMLPLLTKLCSGRLSLFQGKASSSSAARGSMPSVLPVVATAQMTRATASHCNSGWSSCQPSSAAQ